MQVANNTPSRAIPAAQDCGYDDDDVAIVMKVDSPPQEFPPHGLSGSPSA